MSSRNRTLLIICFLIGFMLLVLTRLAFAVSSCTVDGKTWTFLFVRSFDCIDDLNADVADSDKLYTFNYGGAPVSGNPVINGCLGIPNGSYVVIKYNVSYIDYEVYYLPPNASGCQLDSDGDGIPDSTDPCPNNPDPDCTTGDRDGDGIPDSTDPCPNNPNPNCTDPTDPPGPEIPDEIPVGDCVFDLRSFKAWLNTDSAFPFNLLFRFFGLVSPLFDLSPEPPVFEINWDLASYHDKYPYIPATINFNWDFTPYDTYAKLIRSALIISVIIFVVAYGLNSTKERP